LIELVEYLDDSNRSPFALWREGLESVVRARIEIALGRLSSGNLSAIKGVGAGVLEMRLNFGPGFRIYLAREGEQFILLLGGGTKKWQQSDIQTARERWQDCKRRKRIK
jgi:putative addiction module killer protein